MYFRVYLCLLFLLQYNNISAQLSFDHLSVANGLSQSTVLSICRDSKGLMWFGTRDCLNRYDARNIKVYHFNAEDSASISSDDYIYAITEDRQRNLWIGTQNGLNRYLPESDSFERIYHDPEDRSSLSNNSVLCIYQARNGFLWFGTNSGLNLLEDPGSRKFKRFYAGEAGRGLAGNEIYAIHEDDNGNIWVGTTQGLTRISASGKEKYSFTTFRNSPADAGSISNNSVKTIAGDASGNLWIGTETGGLNLFDAVTQKFKRFTYVKSALNGISNNMIRKIAPDKNGRLWIATMDGLDVLDPRSMKFSSYTHDPENRKSLSDNSIKDIFVDVYGSLWIGTMFGGVNVLHPNTIPFTVFQNSRFNNSISSNIISIIMVDSQQNLWIGTEGKGLNYYDRSAGRFTHYLNNPEEASSINSNNIKAIYQDKKGNIWIGLYQGGMDMFIPSSSSFKHFRHRQSDPASLSSDIISDILEDYKSNFWVATSTKGIDLFDPLSQQFRSVMTASSSYQLSSNYVRLMFEDSKHNLWVGTAKGLNMLAPNAKKFKWFLKDNKRPGALISDHINVVFEDRAGNIWVGAHHGGLNLYNPQKQSFTCYRQADGLASDNVLDIREDNDGFLWISTDNGLSRMDIRKRTFNNYNTRDGLPTNEFNYFSSAKDASGRVYFGSYNGLISFFPREIKINNITPRVMFSGLKLFNKPVYVGGDDGILQKDISLSREIVFRYDQNIFTADFAVLNYIRPERNLYAYKLEGFDKDWNQVNIPSATYTNLPAGNYKLLIKGSNNDGLWSDPAYLIIRVLPPFWKTWWAYLAYSIVFAVILVLVILFFRRQARLERDLYYEHINNERQQELYQLKLDFFTKVSHEIRTPLTLILAPLEKLLAFTRGDLQVNKQILHVKDNADRLLRLVSELLDFRKAESGFLKIRVEETDLTEFCRNIFSSFQELALLKEITFNFIVKRDHIRVYIDRIQFEKVLFNLLSNAFKFTAGGGNISVILDEDDNGGALIKVEDDGIGIPYDKQQLIFDDFYQVSQQGGQAAGWGIGLALARNIVELHHGRITAESRPSQNAAKGYTVFTLLLPSSKEKFGTDELKSGGLPGLQTVDAAIDLPFSGNREQTEIKTGEKPVILIVEDNEEVRLFIRESLSDMYQIIESANGFEGWEAASVQIPDVIISDVTMPEMDGLEFCAMVKADERTSHIPVILLTALASHMHQVGGLENGADIYLTKPFSIQVLELSVKNLLLLKEAMRVKFSQQVTLMPKNKVLESPDEKFLARLMQIIEDQMEDPEFNVSVLVDEIGMSQTVLYKKIKALTNLSITDFIKSVRLKQAAQLLEQRKMGIAEVAYAVGFNDRKYFSKEFRKQFGVAPSAYLESVDREY